LSFIHIGQKYIFWLFSVFPKTPDSKIISHFYIKLFCFKNTIIFPKVKYPFKCDHAPVLKTSICNPLLAKLQNPHLLKKPFKNHCLLIVTKEYITTSLTCMTS